MEGDDVAGLPVQESEFENVVPAEFENGTNKRKTPDHLSFHLQLGACNRGKFVALLTKLLWLIVAVVQDIEGYIHYSHTRLNDHLIMRILPPCSVLLVP